MSTFKLNRWVWGLCVTSGSFILLSTLLFLFMPEVAAVEHEPDGSPFPGWGYYMAAALATGMSSIGAGIAVGQVGSAAVAAVSEKPELLGKVLIILGLSEGIAIYGLIVSFVIIAAI